VANSYPISAVAKLTGLPLDTLRAWERRYQTVVPARASRGRLYSEEQIQRLLLLRHAVDHGHSIGQIAGLSDRELRELMEKGSKLANGEPSRNGDRASKDFLSPVLQALDRFDYAATDREISLLAASIANPREFVHRAALPLMRTIGELWHDGKASIAQEHMLSTLLSGLLASLVRTYSSANPPARVLVTTPKNERHAFPSLAAAMLTAAGGLGVIYLGTDLPAADIVLAARKGGADAVLLSLSTTPSAETIDEIRYACEKLPPKISLWLGGPGSLGLELGNGASRTQQLNDFSALEYQLTALGARF